MKEGVNRQILLVEKPSGKLGPAHFRLVEGAMPKPSDGEVLLRVRYISLDAANRAWMHGATYRPALETNVVMGGGSVAEVSTRRRRGLRLAISYFPTPAGRTTQSSPPNTSPRFHTWSR